MVGKLLPVKGGSIGRWHSPSPNWQEKYIPLRTTTYSPCRTVWVVEKCYLPPTLSPGTISTPIENTLRPSLDSHDWCLVKDPLRLRFFLRVTTTPWKIFTAVRKPKNHQIGKENHLNQTFTVLSNIFIFRGFQSSKAQVPIIRMFEHSKCYTSVADSPTDGWTELLCRSQVVPPKAESPPKNHLQGFSGGVYPPKSITRWWFQIFFMFTPIWGRFPI